MHDRSDHVVACSAFSSGPRALSLQLSLLALFLCVQPAAAQEGSITGVVRADDGPPLAYATIRLLDAPYGTLTGEDGRFILTSVPVGAYELEVSMIGYETAVDSAIRVRAGESTAIDIALKVSPITYVFCPESPRRVGDPDGASRARYHRPAAGLRRGPGPGGRARCRRRVWA